MLNVISGLLFFAAFAPYFLAIVRHETAPSPVTWFIWAGVDTLAFLAIRKEKAAAGVITGAMTGAWMVFLLSVFYGNSTMGIIEWVSLGGAATGIALWKITNDAVMAIVCSQVTVVIGAIPTVMAAYENPDQEDPFAWCAWTASCVIGLFTVKKWNLANALQPVNFTLINGTMAFLVVVRPLWI